MTTGSLLFYAAVALWSWVITYFLLFRVFPRTDTPVLPLDEHAGAKATAANPDVFTLKEDPARAPLKSAHARDIGFKSFATGPDLTVEDIVKGLSRE